MTFEQMVTELRDQKVRIYDEGDAFKLQAPKGVLTPGLLEIIKSYSADLLYLVRMGDVRVCPERVEHRPSWRYSSNAHSFICAACRKDEAAA
ncbi:MAG: hypothetical protein NVS2B12_04080 [Ktedonobacteraceae bacterium]